MERSILVVDDDPGIVEMLQRILREAGYNVTGARSAAAALRAVEAMPFPPGLLLTDVVMPGMSGPSLADKLIAQLPELRVVFITGYDDREIVHLYARKRNFACMAKPFRAKTLLAAVQKALGDNPVNGKI